ncbi:MAG: hypothetical protein JETCAE01_09660 [Anaerolineaceae bacterium]|nr:MAG: hypothetical protein JETCAE01_09660 [Anaerolineaceae bacterium]
MRTVEFRRLLDDENALRVRFETERGQILRFVIQLECLFSEDGEWTPIVRYDTAHGYAHRDVMHPSQKEEKTEMSVQDYNEAFNIAMDDIVKKRYEYRRRYEQWLK